MSPRALASALVVLLLSPAAPALSDTGVRQSTYRCERGVALPVSFVNPAGEAGLAVMVVEGKLVTLRAQPGGSGVRYVALDEQDGYRLYTKGDEAFVAWIAADHTAREVTILAGCRRAG